MACVRINRDFCKGCGLCVWVCNQDGLEVADELNAIGVYPVQPVEGATCTGCGRCAAMCPEGGVEIDVDETDLKAPAESTQADLDEAARVTGS
jgi:2-oxoglutarate ferredoxin oxidoreductase subunit delta